MPITIETFISREMEKPFAWRVTDCCATADRRVEEIVGFSPLQRFGRDYPDEASARAWLSEPGGIAVAVNRVMRLSGFKKVDQPHVDDIGLIIFAGRMMAAIWTGAVWFSRDEGGFIGAPLEAAWKIWRIR
ncbi:hypothetical protein OIU34_26580 [Pararhizobium sp. BT-229]|uniref:DUF6950 family protein n=1 Tax=Pararhizobium sp. BT-229 TaxID=2986923 RepID=UPI0021F71A5F|nr:hypothetical protein [Pararhizobium sp. BT-229]MCV9965449.1 hypothetical protein [Pararhizobium sp. BT-229]